MNNEIEKIADKIIRRLSDDISDRRGIKHEWKLIDREVMEGELEPTWRKIIVTELGIAGYRLPPDEISPAEVYLAQLDKGE